jgi:predicted nucleotidyltransferase
MTPTHSNLSQTAIALRPNLTVDRQKLTELCDRWQITHLELFGSVLRDDFRPDSDIDVLVTFADTARITFFDLDSIERQLSLLFENRPVDLVTRRAIEQSHNSIRRAAILGTAQPFYAKP